MTVLQLTLFVHSVALLSCRSYYYQNNTAIPTIGIRLLVR